MSLGEMRGRRRRKRRGLLLNVGVAADKGLSTGMGGISPRNERIRQRVRVSMRHLLADHSGIECWSGIRIVLIVRVLWSERVGVVVSGWTRVRIWLRP